MDLISAPNPELQVGKLTPPASAAVQPRLPYSLHDVRTGDALLFSGNSPTGFLLKTFVSSQWNHAGIAIRFHQGQISLTGDGELYVYETNTGTRWDSYFQEWLVGAAFSALDYIIDKYNVVAWRPLHPHLRTPQLAARTLAFARATKGNRFPSSSLPFLSVWLGIPLQDSADKGSDMFCSELMANYYTFCFGPEYLEKLGYVTVLRDSAREHVLATVNRAEGTSWTLGLVSAEGVARRNMRGELIAEPLGVLSDPMTPTLTSHQVLRGLFGPNSPTTPAMYTPGHYSHHATPQATLFNGPAETVFHHYSDMLYIILQPLVIIIFLLVVVWMSLPAQRDKQSSRNVNGTGTRLVAGNVRTPGVIRGN